MIGCLCSASTVICGMCSWFLMFLMFLQNESGSSEVSEASSGRSGSSGSRGLAAASAADSGIPRFGASHELLGLLAWPQSVHFNTEKRGNAALPHSLPHYMHPDVQYNTLQDATRALVVTCCPSLAWFHLIRLRFSTCLAGNPPAPSLLAKVGQNKMVCGLPCQSRWKALGDYPQSLVRVLFNTLPLTSST